jgi:hypothetical protein
MRLTKTKIAVAYILTLVSSSAWAEKYEFVRLGVSDFRSENSITGNYHGDSIELKSGDVAKVIAVPDKDMPHYLYLWDGTVLSRFDIAISGQPHPNMIVGPGTLIVASSYKDRKAKVHIAIERAAQSGSTTLAWNGNDWEGSSNAQQASNNSFSPVPDPNGIKYDRLLGWCWFTDTPWIYSYTNGSWYYMRSSNEGIYVWNANLPNSGWMRLRG